jgi:hypothetical protein
MTAGSRAVAPRRHRPAARLQAATRNWDDRRVVHAIASNPHVDGSTRCEQARAPLLAEVPRRRIKFANMNPSPHSFPAGAAGMTHADLTRKADICAKVLVEARRLARIGQAGATLNQLMGRAGELLDDVEEILGAVDPARNGPGSAIASALRRELDQIRATTVRRPRDG